MLCEKCNLSLAECLCDDLPERMAAGFAGNHPLSPPAAVIVAIRENNDAARLAAGLPVHRWGRWMPLTAPSSPSTPPPPMPGKEAM